MAPMRIILALAAIALPFACAAGATYSEDDEVPITLNTVGPRNNPSERYELFQRVPICPPGKRRYIRGKLAGHLVADRQTRADFHLSFSNDRSRVPFCGESTPSYQLGAAEVAKLRRAVREEYWFDVMVDGDLQLKAFVGQFSTPNDDLGLFDQLQQGVFGTSDSVALVYQHFLLTLYHNGGQVVNATLLPSANSDDFVVLPLASDADQSLKLSPRITIKWKETDVPYEARVESLKRSQLSGSLEIHWLSIVNSLVLVVLLTSFLAVILVRVVHNDFTRAMREDEEEGLEEDSGWKLLHADVFRSPPLLSLLAACVGTGTHLILVTVSLLLLSLADVFHINQRGSVAAAGLVLYAGFAFANGFVSGRLFKQFTGSAKATRLAAARSSAASNPSGSAGAVRAAASAASLGSVGAWATNLLLTASIFPAFALVNFSVVNSIAWSHRSTTALPALTITLIVAAFAFVVLPFTIVGGIVGRNVSQPYKPPSRPNVRPRAIPEASWHSGAVAQLLLGGFLPFSAISIELHYLLVSWWGHQLYSLFGILLIGLLLLAVVASFVSIGLTYFQLSSEDYRWWWRSFLSTATVGVFIFAYAVYFFHQHSSMSGVVQSAAFFGHMANLALAASLMLGAIGFYSSFLFVDFIYQSLKVE